MGYDVRDREYDLIFVSDHSPIVVGQYHFPFPSPEFLDYWTKEKAINNLSKI